MRNIKQGLAHQDVAIGDFELKRLLTLVRTGRHVSIGHADTLNTQAGEEGVSRFEAISGAARAYT